MNLNEMKIALDALKNETRSLNENGDVDGAKAKLEEIRSLKEQIDVQTELEQEERAAIEAKIETTITKEKREMKSTEMEVRSAFGKLLAGKMLNEEERQLVSGATGESGGFLIPADVKTQIEEYKRDYKQAKNYVGVVPTNSNSGSVAIAASANATGLVAFDDDNSGLDETSTVFEQRPFAVKNYGTILPIARTFLQDEQGGFMAYVSRLFAQKAITTENAQIFTKALEGKTAKSVDAIEKIKGELTRGIDPVLEAGFVVFANQSAYAMLEEMTDANKRPMLQPSPTEPTQKTLFGYPVIVFSDATVGKGSTPTLIAGNMVEGIKFVDRGVYEVAVSEDAGFTKNQVLARVVERFDVVQGDKDAYMVFNIAKAAAGTGE